MNIYQSINAIMEEICPISKDKTTKGSDTFAFKYRGIDQVMNVLQPLLAKHKIFIVPKVLEQVREKVVTLKGTTEKQTNYSLLKIEFIFCAEDGSSISAITIGEGMDTGDKASNKAMSIAFKYACFQVFCIPTEDAADPDAEVHNTIVRKAILPLEDVPPPPNMPPTAIKENQSEKEEAVAMVKCVNCGKLITETKFNMCLEKYNVGVCSKECLDTIRFGD